MNSLGDGRNIHSMIDHFLKQNRYYEKKNTSKKL